MKTVKIIFLKFNKDPNNRFNRFDVPILDQGEKLVSILKKIDQQISVDIINYLFNDGQCTIKVGGAEISSIDFFVKNNIDKIVIMPSKIKRRDGIFPIKHNDFINNRSVCGGYA